MKNPSRKHYGNALIHSRLSPDLPDGIEGHGLSLGDLSRVGYGSMLFAPLLLVTCGTTAARIGSQFVTRVAELLGELPECINYLMIDGASTDDEMDPAHHFVLDVAGCGTDPNRGREVFERNWAVIFRKVVSAISRLSSSSPLIEVAYARLQACNAVVIGGSGGAGGGMAVSCISLVNDAMKHHRVRQPRIDFLQLGADMPMRDVGRDPQMEQKIVVPDTCYNNLVKIFSDFESDSVSRETRPDGTMHMVRHCEQLQSISVMDQSNECGQLSSTNEFIDMVAGALLFRYLTPATTFLADRDRDHDELGSKGRGSKRRSLAVSDDSIQ